MKDLTNEYDPYYGYFNDKFVKNTDSKGKIIMDKDTLSTKNHNRYCLNFTIDLNHLE